MAEVRIRWTQRIMGRFPGQEETVERTSLIDALVAQGRVEVVQEALPVADHIALLGVVEPAALEEVFTDMSAPVGDPVENTATETAGDGSLDDLPAPVQEAKPGPRPRAPRRETGED